MCKNAGKHYRGPGAWSITSIQEFVTEMFVFFNNQIIKLQHEFDGLVIINQL